MTESVVPRFALGYYDIPIVKYDPAAAEKLLDQAGWKRGAGGVRMKNGKPLSIDIVIPSGYVPSETLATILQLDYSKIGAAATIHTNASGQYFGPYSAAASSKRGNSTFRCTRSRSGPSMEMSTACSRATRFRPTASTNRATATKKSMHSTTSLPALATIVRCRDKAAAAYPETRSTMTCRGSCRYERGFLAVYDKRLTGFHPNSFSNWGGDPWNIDI